MFFQITKKLIYFLYRFTHPRDIADFGPKILAEGSKLPTRVIVAMQSEEAFGGSYRQNRLGFYPMFATNVTMLVNDEHKPMKMGYNLTYTEENVLMDYIDAYVGLYQETGQYSGHNEMTITRGQFKNGFTLFVFDLSQSHTTGNYDPGHPSQGSCSVKINFKKEALTSNVAIYCLLMYEKSYAIHDMKADFRNISFD